MLQVQRPGDPQLGEEACVVVTAGAPMLCNEKQNTLRSQFDFEGSQVGNCAYPAAGVCQFPIWP